MVSTTAMAHETGKLEGLASEASAECRLGAQTKRPKRDAPHESFTCEGLGYQPKVAGNLLASRYSLPFEFNDKRANDNSRGERKGPLP